MVSLWHTLWSSHGPQITSIGLVNYDGWYVPSVDVYNVCPKKSAVTKPKEYAKEWLDTMTIMLNRVL